MLSFSPVTIENREEIEKYLKKNTAPLCDFSFSNIFVWKEVFSTHFATAEGFLIIRSLSHHKKTRYLMPVGGEQRNLKNVLHLMIEDAKKNDSEFEMVSISEEMKETMEKLMPETFVFEDNRDYCDYIYLAKDLISLKGKKLHSKRNHINKFKELYPDYEYLTVTPELIPECIEMHKKWCMENNCKEIDSLEREKCAVQRALKYFERLPLKGGALRVNGEIAAFTFGQRLTEDTFDVLIEKAFTSVTGAYTMINQCFAEKEAKDFVFINREEDLGVEGLRKAKLSYNPVKFAQKFVAHLK